MALKEISIRDLLTQAYKRIWGNESYKVEPTTIPTFSIGTVNPDGGVRYPGNSKISSSGGVDAFITPFTAGGHAHLLEWNALGVGATITITGTYYDGTAFTIVMSAVNAGYRYLELDCLSIIITGSAVPAANELTLIGEW